MPYCEDKEPKMICPNCNAEVEPTYPDEPWNPVYICDECGYLWENGEWDTSKGFVCEQHPDKEFPHDDCSGPGIPDYKGVLNARGER